MSRQFPDLDFSMPCMTDSTLSSPILGGNLLAFRMPASELEFSPMVQRVALPPDEMPPSFDMLVNNRFGLVYHCLGLYAYLPYLYWEQQQGG